MRRRLRPCVAVARAIIFLAVLVAAMGVGAYSIVQPDICVHP